MSSKALRVTFVKVRPTHKTAFGLTTLLCRYVCMFDVLFIVYLLVLDFFTQIAADALRVNFDIKAALLDAKTYFYSYII